MISNLKQIISRIPVIGFLARKTKLIISTMISPFPGSEQYWINRYILGGNSGAGSSGKFAKFKAEVINNFVSKNGIKTIIEFGCGDGYQLQLAKYPEYSGYDVSPEAISICESLFKADDSKTFKLMSEYSSNVKAELTLSLDVIYHLVEDDNFALYMKRLFESSEKYVIIYSSNTFENPQIKAPHVEHRRFKDWIDSNKPDWRLIEFIPNKYPSHTDGEGGSLSDFYIFEH